MNKKITKIVLAIILALFLISLALVLFAQMQMFSALRIAFGSVYVLFLPGFIISYIFFPRTKEFEEDKGKTSHHENVSFQDPENKKYFRGEKEKGTIDWIERIALSFALSIAIVPLAVFYLNLIGIKINLLNSFLTILGILIISAIILYIHKSRRK